MPCHVPMYSRKYLAHVQWLRRCWCSAGWGSCAREKKSDGQPDEAPRERLSWSGATSHNLEKAAGTGSRDGRTG